MKYHLVVEKIVNLLKENNFWFETFEHQEVTTSEEASQVRSGYTLSQGAKAMIIRLKEKSGNKYFLMLVLPGDKKINFDKVKNDLNAKDIRFATAEEIDVLTDGVQIGGIPPFGNLFGLKVFTDPSVFENEKIIFNAGDRSYSIGMYSKDYKKVSGLQILEII